jgi:SAM-dependent methyltransferase
VRAVTTAAWPVGLYEDALRSGGGHLLLRYGDRAEPMDVVRWCAVPDAADHDLLARCGGPTLDVGCGPGRLVAALAARGIPALGVDIAPVAVALTLASGGLVLRRSVFDRVPGEGRWATVLLADGNVGIGGDPRALLGRIRDLLHPRGRALVEVEPQEVDEQVLARVEDAQGRLSEPFPWARLGSAAAARIATQAGLSVTARWSREGRCFLALTRATRSPWLEQNRRRDQHEDPGDQ